MLHKSNGRNHTVIYNYIYLYICFTYNIFILRFLKPGYQDCLQKTLKLLAVFCHPEFVKYIFVNTHKRSWQPLDSQVKKRNTQPLNREMHPKYSFQLCSKLSAYLLQQQFCQAVPSNLSQ